MAFLQCRNNCTILHTKKALKGLLVGVKLCNSIRRVGVRENSTRASNGYKNSKVLCPEF